MAADTIHHMSTKQSFGGFFKEGTRYFNGVDEVILRNIDAAVDLSNLTRTSMGPNGMKKIIKNHFSKIFVTGDCATILNEAEIQHPAAKMLVNASQMQAEQIGDGTNFVITFAGECLNLASQLIRAGINTKDIVIGFQEALSKALEILPTLYSKVEIDLHNVESVKKALKTPLSSHQYLNCEHLADLVAQACVQTNQNPKLKFSVDNIRIAKALGGSVDDSYVVKGFVVKREVMGTIRRMENCKIAVFSTSFDLPESDTKMQTVFNSGAEMANYNLSRENRMDQLVSSIAQKGVNVVVCQSKITEVAMHFLEKHGIMALQLPSNWDIKRLCRAVKALPNLRICAPQDDEIGHCDLCEVKEVGSTPLVFFQNENSQVSTIIIRGSTPNIIDDVERSIDDAVNSYLVMTEYPQLVPGAGATEMELSCQIAKWAESRPGMDQYGARKFAEALEVVPKIIAETSGLKIADFLAKLRAAHNKGDKDACVDIIDLQVGNAEKLGVYDVAHVKSWALRFATDVVVTLLRVDQICISKPAQGPAPRSPEARDID